MPDRPSRLWLAAVGVVLVALAALVLHATSVRSDVLVANGVPEREGVVRLSSPAQLTCQEGLVFAGEARSVRLWGTGVGRRNPPFDVLVHRVGSTDTIARGHAPALAEGLRPFVVRLDRPVRAPAPLGICVRTRRGGDLDLYGTLPATPADTTPPQQALIFQGRDELPGDLHVDLLRDAPASLLARVPAALTGAGTYKPLGVGAWTWWLALAVLLAVVPWRIAVMVRSAALEDAGGDGSAAPRS